MSFLTRTLSGMVMMCILHSHVGAQILEKTAGKINSYKNINYTDVLINKWSFQENTDTSFNKVYVSPVAGNHKSGGYYKVAEKDLTYSFDGNKLLVLDKTDRTYKIFDDAEYGQSTRTLLYWGRQINSYLKRKLKIDKLHDTIIANKANYHFRVYVRDSVIKNERTFTIDDIVIDKQNFLPLCIRETSRGLDDAGTAMGLMEEHHFTKFKFNEKQFPDLSSITIPSGYKPWVKGHVAPLANGIKAPELKLYDMKGQLLAPETWKDKLVLLSFDFVGCPHCVDAEQVLKKLRVKYSDTELVIAMIYPIDNAAAVLRHNEINNIRIASFTTNRRVRDDYPFEGYPAFYLINKRGLIAGSFVGFSNELQNYLISVINKDSQ